MAEETGIERFLEAQRFGYDCALREMKEGHKWNHWIWYIFPQLLGLGHSSKSQFYGIKGLEEAKEYLAHPVLGARLREITQAVLEHKDMSIEEIMPGIDSAKLRSSMTLFDAVCPDDIFAQVLEQFYDGKRDSRTLKMLGIQNPD